MPAADFATRLADQLALLAVNEAAIQIPETRPSLISTVMPRPMTTRRHDRHATGGADAHHRRPLHAGPEAGLCPRAAGDADRRGGARLALRPLHLRRGSGDLCHLHQCAQGITDTEANPDGVVWPTLGAIGGAADRVLTRSTSAATSSQPWALRERAEWRDHRDRDQHQRPRHALADGGQICRARILPGYFSNQRLVTSWTFPAAFYSAASYSFLATFSTRNNANAGRDCRHRHPAMRGDLLRPDHDLDRHPGDEPDLQLRLRRRRVARHHRHREVGPVTWQISFTPCAALPGEADPAHARSAGGVDRDQRQRAGPVLPGGGRPDRSGRDLGGGERADPGPISLVDGILRITLLLLYDKATATDAQRFPERSLSPGTVPYRYRCLCPDPCPRLFPPVPCRERRHDRRPEPEGLGRAGGGRGA